MNTTDHLVKAKNYIDKGEDYYRKAAEEIVVAIEGDPSLTYQAIGDALGRSKDWVRKLIHWVNNGDRDATPFKGSAEVRQKSAAKTVARENPQVIAEAIAQAPPEAQRKIADAIVKSPATERSLKEAVSPPRRKPREPKAAEEKLGDAVFTLWEVGELLMDEAPTDAQRVRMSGLAEKAVALATGITKLLDTGQFEQAFRDLIDEVKAEA